MVWLFSVFLFVQKNEKQEQLTIYNLVISNLLLLKTKCFIFLLQLSCQLETIKTKKPCAIGLWWGMFIWFLFCDKWKNLFGFNKDTKHNNKHSLLFPHNNEQQNNVYNMFIFLRYTSLFLQLSPMGEIIWFLWGGSPLFFKQIFQWSLFGDFKAQWPQILLSILSRQNPKEEYLILKRSTKMGCLFKEFKKYHLLWEKGKKNIKNIVLKIYISSPFISHLLN